MPANRSRTLEWRRCLKQVQERHGALEIAIANQDPNDSAAHLVWRVRLISFNDAELVVEQPAALGRTIDIAPGIELVVVFNIGQNSWSFTTRTLGNQTIQSPDRKSMSTLRLATPQTVHRCQRRSHSRVEIESLNLPMVEVWPLLDPKSVLVAERATEIEARPQTADAVTSSEGEDLDSFTLPEVGPKFTASLVNLGGGGVGLRVTSAESQALAHHKLFWIRIILPSLSAPICATGKLVHTHMESSHDTYAGLAFDFTFNPCHQHFVIDQICQYVALQQRAQAKSLEEVVQRRRSA